MSEGDPGLALRHMRDYAIEARDMIQGASRADIDNDRMLNLALVRLLEIIGEAANRVPSTAQWRFPNIPWSQLIG
jgi:uncharacterized protein with HEPN domain